VTVLILNRGPLSLRPYHEWLAGDDGYQGDLLLLASAEHLGRQPLPVAGGGYAHVEAVADYDATGRVEARALELAERFDIRHVVACQEVDLQRAAAIRSLLGIGGQGVASADAYRDKLVMKRLVTAAGIPVAPHADVETATDVLRFAREHGYPLVLKPRDGLSSLGLRIVDDEAALLAWLADGFGDDQGGPKGLLVEAFVPGEMYHVDGFVQDGRVTVAWPSQYLYRLASFGDGEPRLDATVEPGPLADRLVGFATDVVRALPTVPCSTFHAEVFRTPDDRLVLCEIASRNGGALIKAVLRAMYGVDFPSAWVRASLGLPVPGLPAPGEPVARPARMAGQVLLPKRPGRLRAIPERPDLDWVEHFEVFARPGQQLSAAASSGDYLAGMVVSAPTRDECLRRMRWAALWLAEALRVDDPVPA
jgi:phosphoribosylaminoimidazole carboxylase (NCAIR synthetase)